MVITVSNEEDRTTNIVAAFLKYFAKKFMHLDCRLT
jgi:hypothetical protein